MKKTVIFASILTVILALISSILSGCNVDESADLKKAVSQVGMPEIINFQEKRMMKTLYELRDQSVATHSYIVNQMKGCLVYLGASIGYGIPYAAQYSAPHVPHYFVSGAVSEDDQAEPNGLFMPNNAHGTWAMIKDQASDNVKPVYIEPDVIVSPFRLSAQECKQ